MSVDWFQEDVSSIFRGLAERDRLRPITIHSGSFLERVVLIGPPGILSFVLDTRDGDLTVTEGDGRCLVQDEQEHLVDLRRMRPLAPLPGRGLVAYLRLPRLSRTHDVNAVLIAYAGYIDRHGTRRFSKLQ